MGRRLLPLVILAAWCGAVWGLLALAARPPAVPGSDGPRVLGWNAFFNKYLIQALPIADRFDFPVRPPDGAGASIARPFGNGGHAGEDWNTAPGDGDLGEPVVSPADGWVSLAMDFQSGWGKVVMIDYRLPPGQNPAAVEMLFGHLSEIDVQSHAFVRRGQVIGRMGNADGLYKAHLHWEVRPAIGLGLGGAYSDDLKPWVAPSPFIQAHRGQPGAAAKAASLPPAQWDAWGSD